MDAEGRVPLEELGEGSSSGADLTEFLPIEKPIPKNTAHKITNPKNSASIFPVPRVISVSSFVLIVGALAGVIESLGAQASFCGWRGFFRQ